MNRAAPCRGLGLVHATKEELLLQPVFMAMIHGSRRGCDEAFTDLEHLANSATVVRNRVDQIQICPSNVNKADGLRVVLEHFGLSFNQAVAIGDEDNDVEMLRSAGIGIAMRNAPSRVQDCADAVTARNDDAGVAKVLDRIAEALDHRFKLGLSVFQ